MDDRHANRRHRGDAGETGDTAHHRRTPHDDSGRTDRARQQPRHSQQSPQRPQKMRPQRHEDQHSQRQHPQPQHPSSHRPQSQSPRPQNQSAHRRTPREDAGRTVREQQQARTDGVRLGKPYHHPDADRNRRGSISEHRNGTARPVSYATHIAEPRRSTEVKIKPIPTAEAETEYTPQRTKSRYVPALDGLRAFAVIAVILYHMGLDFAPGGLMGVTIFFVISGYLITGLLITELRDTNTIKLKDFWLRRVKRLVPAIVFCLICVAMLCTCFNHVLLTKMRDDIFPSLFFFMNWWEIFHNVSYFQALGAPSPLTHFWSLGIEEQFYIIWPLLLLFLFKRGTTRKAMRRGILALAILSAIEMALLYTPTGDPSRIYYGTDTRAFSLLIGAWLAFVWPSAAFGEGGVHNFSHADNVKWDLIGAAALCGVIAIVVFSNGFSAFPYRGGILLCSALTALLMASLVNPDGLIGKFAGLKPFVWVGKRSYGMYLWHYPIILLMTNRNATAGPDLFMVILQIALIFAISDFSYRFIENPVRKGKLWEWMKDVRAGNIDFNRYVREHLVPVCAGVLVCVVAVGGCALVPPTAGVGAGAQLLQQAEQEQNEGPSQAEQIAQAPVAEPYEQLLIGDSVSLRIEPVFDWTFPYGCIDAEVGRYLSSASAVYDYYKNAGAVGDTVIFSLGTNGPVDDGQINELMADVGSEKKVYFINTRSPNDWVESTNAALARAATRYPNVTLIDWYSRSDDEDLFDGDGTHLTSEASVVYAQMICDALGYKTRTPDIDAFYETYDEAHPAEAAAQAAAHEEQKAAAEQEQQEESES